MLSVRLSLVAGLFIGTVQAQELQTAGAMSNPVFARAIELRGQLGAKHVRMHLQPKTEDRDSVEGSYVVVAGAPQSQKILLAGEVTADRLSMEESVDGTDVSGQWDGDLQGQTVRGIWLSADGNVRQDFTLEIVNTDPQKTKKRRSKK
ncbi:hypothetical protein Undi14_13135 [Undibacterium sp. 14-3-2]|uniref:hypothetical protein n=1 Tax=Undibacterium sp. 14-3-2 TaxID=2800129 RepID=UPI0019059750|nr:hypothetical protein [Undibacterium sp. 14-3-2]MBK1890979.1 hypothetical protein [Undibacterium sp. 14-3-2]